MIGFYVRKLSSCPYLQTHSIAYFAAVIHRHDQKDACKKFSSSQFYGDLLTPRHLQVLSRCSCKLPAAIAARIKASVSTRHQSLRDIRHAVSRSLRTFHLVFATRARRMRRHPLADGRLMLAFKEVKKENTTCGRTRQSGHLLVECRRLSITHVVPMQAM
jgi:hypothetical protein